MNKKYNIVLINCVSQKTPHKNPAEKLYQGALFTKSMKYARQVIKPDGIFILSALHHVVRYDEVIEPYEKTLLKMSKQECADWATEVLKQLEERFCTNGNTLDDFNFIILAGSKYYEGIIDSLPHYELPLGKLKIGERLQVLGNAAKIGHLLKENEYDKVRGK